MRREELALVILGELDESFIDEAMPEKAAFSAGNDTAGVQHPEMIKEVAEVSKRDIRIYWITRALGMAAVVALIVGAVVLLVQNWDKIAVSGSERPGAVTTVSDTAITSSSYEITGHEVTPRMEAAWKLTNDYMYGLLFTITGDEVKDTMKDSCGAEPSSITPFEVPEGAEEAILYIYENMPFFSYNADMGAVVSVTRGLTQVDYTIEAKSETDANTVYEDIKDKLEEMLGQPDSSDDTYCSWDVMETGICFDLRKQPNDQVKFFMYNKYISGTKDDNLFEQITDTSMPEPYDSMEYPLGNFDFYSLWQAKLFGADQIVHFDYEKKNEYRKLVEGIETPYTLYDSPNFYGMARTMKLTDDEITEAIKTINEHFENSINLLNNTSYIYTEEDIAVIKNADDSAAAQHFASEYSIVVGENVFSPKWLYYHTAEDYKAAGIDPYSMHSLLEKYSELGLTDEAWRAFRKKLILYAYSEMYPEKDRVYTYELDISEPLGDDAFRIFEDMFCGEWEYAGKYDRHNATFDMTYGGTSFKFGRIFGIFETDEIYVIRYNDGGGVLECYVIEKSSPDIMYNTDVLTSLGGIEEIKLGDDELVKYINRKPAAAELKPGDLSIPGLTYLFHLYGSDFEEYYRAVIERDSYQSISEDENLYIGNGHILDDFRQYLVDMSENSVVIALPYVHDTQTAHQTPIYFELIFTKDESGEWSVEYQKAGIKVYSPIRTLTDDEVELVAGEIKPAEQLAEFQSYNSIEEEWDTYGAGEFLDSLGIPELKTLYYGGKYIARMPVSFFIPYADGYTGTTYYRMNGQGYETDGAIISVTAPDGGNDWLCFSTGFTCDSFLAAFDKIFTGELETVMLSKFSWFTDYGGELYFRGGERGSDLSHIYTEYELVSRTDDEIVFNAIGYKLNYEDDMNSTYDPAKKEDYKKQYQTYRFVKTENGWRIAEAPTGTDWY